MHADGDATRPETSYAAPQTLREHLELYKERQHISTPLLCAALRLSRGTLYRALARPRAASPAVKAALAEALELSPEQISAFPDDQRPTPGSSRTLGTRGLTWIDGRLKERARAEEVSVTALLRHFDLGRGTTYDILAGRHRPSSDTLAKLAACLKVSIEELHELLDGQFALDAGGTHQVLNPVRAARIARGHALNYVSLSSGVGVVSLRNAEHGIALPPREAHALARYLETRLQAPDAAAYVRRLALRALPADSLVERALARAQIEHGWTRSDVADRLGTSRQALDQIISGAIRQPDPGIVSALARLLGLSGEALLAGRGTGQPYLDENASLRERREAAGLLQAEVADHLHVHRGYVSRWESGRIRVPARYRDALDELLARHPSGDDNNLPKAS